ncbi:MAG: hypothetical protein IKX60_07770 [Bacteroidales bacterium]|nr:hypothetical protein [Bacteroidales bacterium]
MTRYIINVFLLLLILTGCEKEGSSRNKEKLFFGTVWKLDKVDYYLDGQLVSSSAHNADNALYVHYFEDLSITIYLEDGRYRSYVQTHNISDFHINISPNVPERVVTSVTQTSMVIETDGLEHMIYPESFDYNHSVAYYSAAKKSSLASSFEGEWHNYKAELYRDGQEVFSNDQDYRVKYSKDGLVTYSDPALSVQGNNYLLIDDKLAFSQLVSPWTQTVWTVSINGDEMVQEESSPTILGTMKYYFRKVK